MRLKIIECHDGKERLHVAEDGLDVSECGWRKRNGTSIPLRAWGAADDFDWCRDCTRVVRREMRKIGVEI